MSGNSSFRLEVNGEVYHSIDDVPADLRPRIEAMLADDDGDGIPDVAQRGDASTHVTTTETFVVDGQWYGSIDDVPPAHRSLLRGLVDRDELGVVGAPTTTSRTPASPLTRPSPAGPTPNAPPLVSAAGPSSRTKLLLAFLAIDVVAVAIVLFVVLR